MERIKIGGIMESEGRSLVRLTGAPFAADTAGILIDTLGRADINLELVVQALGPDQRAHFALVIGQKDLEPSLALLEGVRNELGAAGVSYSPDVAVLSVFGPHLREKPRVPGMMFTAIASVGITPLAIATSISSVSAVVEGSQLGSAVEVLLEVFDAPYQSRKRPGEW